MNQQDVKHDGVRYPVEPVNQRRLNEERLGCSFRVSAWRNKTQSALPIRPLRKLSVQQEPESKLDVQTRSAALTLRESQVRDWTVAAKMARRL